MSYYLIAIGLLLHTLYWGAGFAMAFMPSPWRRFWPVLAAPAGLTLQSLAVWTGAYANLRGTESYAWWAELIPAALLVFAFLRHDVRRHFRSDLARFGSLWLAMAGALVAIVTPLALAADFLTTISLGSCDAADYAAGARILEEFARSDRTGFLGLTEVVSVMSVDNFFDFWLELNHFTPSALIALNVTVFGREPYEITGLLTAVLLITSMPVVFWLARAVFRYDAGVSVWLALIYALSPITWYAVFQVAPAQLLAAQAIALLTWTGVALWRSDLGWRRGVAMSGVLATAYGLILGSYTFIVIVCLLPAAAYVGGMTIWNGRWRDLVRWTFLMFLPLAAAAIVFMPRVYALPERLMLFQMYDFGWRIPPLTPEGWLGMLRGPSLESFSLWVRVPLWMALAMLLIAALGRAARRHQESAYIAICLSVPPLVGYVYLTMRGYKLDNNSSYDAYKLFSVFYPGVLCAVCYWVTLGRRDGPVLVGWRAAMIVVVSAFMLNSAFVFSARLRSPPLMVTGDLLQLREVEGMPDINSLNVRFPDVWSRLWANAFLLRIPQYFYSATYEGRRSTSLRGEWDLNGGLIQIQLPGASAPSRSYFSLAPTRSPFFLRARETDGWYDIEKDARTGDRWRWTKEAPTIVVENPHRYPVLTTWHFIEVSSLDGRDFEMNVAGKSVGRTVWVGVKPRDIVVSNVNIPPGETPVQFKTSAPLGRAQNSDKRLLGFRIHGIMIESQDETVAVTLPSR